MKKGKSRAVKTQLSFLVVRLKNSPKIRPAALVTPTEMPCRQKLISENTYSTSSVFKNFNSKPILFMEARGPGNETP